MTEHTAASAAAITVLATLVFAKQNLFSPFSQQLDQVGVITLDSMD